MTQAKQSVQIEMEFSNIEKWRFRSIAEQGGDRLARGASGVFARGAVKFAFEFGYLVQPNVVAAACRDGNLEIVKYLRSEGCPWDESALRLAKRSGQQNLVQWLIDNDCPRG